MISCFVVVSIVVVFILLVAAGATIFVPSGDGVELVDDEASSRIFPFSNKIELFPIEWD